MGAASSACSPRTDCARRLHEASETLPQTSARYVWFWFGLAHQYRMRRRNYTFNDVTLEPAKKLAVCRAIAEFSRRLLGYAWSSRIAREERRCVGCPPARQPPFRRVFTGGVMLSGWLTTLSVIPVTSRTSNGPSLGPS
jgi:hypothetical protein